MFELKTLISRICIPHVGIALPAAVLPWLSRSSIKIPAERQSVATQLDKLAAIVLGPALDCQRASALQAVATVEVEKAAFALDSLLDEIRLIGTITPKLTACCAAAVAPPAEPLAAARDIEPMVTRQAPLQEAA